MGFGGKLRQRLRRTLKSAGIEIRRVKSYPKDIGDLQQFLHLRNIHYVLDVGANIGQFASNLFAAGFTGTIISFEPMPAEHAKLAERAAKNKRWLVAPAMALSNRSGTAEFHVAANSISSSLLPMENVHLEAAPQSAEITTIQVKLERLDAIFSSFVPEGGALLKIDTQGTERDVLEGSTGIMERLDGIKTEMSFVPLYKGQALFHEIYDMIVGYGFVLADLVPGFRRKTRAQDLLQCDGLFLRPLGGSKVQ